MKQEPIKPETSFGDDVLHGLRDFFAAVKRGEPITQRTVKLDLAPARYKPADVKRLRESLGVSQAIFGQLLAVSTELVQKWERGTRVPQPVHRRILDDLSLDPKRWLQRLSAAQLRRAPGRGRKLQAA